MAFDGRAVVEEGGRVTVTGVPYEVGREVDVQVTAHPQPEHQRASEVVADLRRMARYLKEKYPNAPLLSDEDISRESIYAEDGL